MTAAFIIASIVAVGSTVLAITRKNPVHALLYVVVSLLAVALLFFLVGATFVAALEVIIYAGAIMVLFVFVIMMLGLAPEARAREARWLAPSTWIGPAILSAVLLAELVYALAWRPPAAGPVEGVPPAAVGVALFGPYLLGVELSAILLLAGLVGAYRLGHRVRTVQTRPAALAPTTTAPEAAEARGETR